MKAYLSYLTLILFVTACQPEPVETPPEPPIVVNSEFLPPVKQLKYYINDATFFEYADTGRYVFSADTIGNKFKVNVLLEKKDVFFGETDSTHFTYNYDQFYHLTSIERVNPGGFTQSIKLFYTGDKLERFEQWTGTTKNTTYPVTHESVPTGTKITVGPYRYPDPSSNDSISQSVFFNTQGKVIRTEEKLRSQATGYNVIWNFTYNYIYSGNDIIEKSGYQKINTDSIVSIYTYTREAGESPVLPGYLEKLYGKEFYAILDFLELAQIALPGGSMNLLVLPGQKRASETGYDYLHVVYTVGATNPREVSTSSYTSTNTLDGQHRLIKSKVTSDQDPFYYTWEVTYQ